MPNRNTQINNALLPFFTKILQSPEEFFQCLGGFLGLTDGLYLSVAASQFNFFSTSKIVENTMVARLFNIGTSVGIRANWYYNFGAGIGVLKKVFYALEGEEGVSKLQNILRRLEKLNNKQWGLAFGLLSGASIYLYIMTHLAEDSYADIFKSPNYATIKDDAIINVIRNFDQSILVMGGFSNLFSYVGNWIDGITGNKTLYQALSSGFGYLSTLLPARAAANTVSEPAKCSLSLA